MLNILEVLDDATIDLDPPEHYAVLLGYQVEAQLRAVLRQHGPSMSFFEQLMWQERCVNRVPLFVTAQVERVLIIHTQGHAETLTAYLPAMDIEAYARWLLARGVLPLPTPPAEG